MKWKLSLVLSGLLFLVYQNCSPKHNNADTDEYNKINLASIYPYYDAKPTYFESLQLTESYPVKGGWKYQFVASVVNIDQPETPVDVRITITNEAGTVLCPTLTAKVTSGDSHIIVDDCGSTKKASKVKMLMSVRTGTKWAPLREFIFDIQ